MKNKLWLSFIPLSLAIMFCSVGTPFPTDPADGVEPPPTDTFTPPAPLTGYITGNLSYPSEMIPPLRVVAWNVVDGSYSYIDTPANQFEYIIEVPVGTYYVVAYVLGGDGFPSGLAGGYTQMVPCGLAYGCDDHTLIPVMVEAGVMVSGIDPGDWYGDPAAFPPMP